MPRVLVKPINKSELHQKQHRIGLQEDCCESELYSMIKVTFFISIRFNPGFNHPGNYYLNSLMSSYVKVLLLVSAGIAACKWVGVTEVN